MLHKSGQNVILSSNDYLLAGSLSGFISRAIVQPLDVLKIRFQLQVEPIERDTRSKYHGLIQAVRCIAREEGPVAFWKGHVPAQLQSVTFSGLQFMSFELLVRLLVRMNVIMDLGQHSGSMLKSSNTIHAFFCGSLAGAIAAVCTQPLDVLRTRFIAQGEPKFYVSIPHAALYIASHEGVTGYFRGLAPSLLLMAPQTGCQFAFYRACNHFFDVIRHRWSSRRDELSAGVEASPVKSGGPVQSLVCGAMAGMGAKCIIYPLDMMKKRMQIHGFEQARGRFGRIHSPHSIRDCLNGILTTEGVGALFKGLKPTMLKSCFSLAIRFTMYEQICQFLSHIHSQKGDERTF